MISHDSSSRSTKGRRLSGFATVAALVLLPLVEASSRPGHGAEMPLTEATPALVVSRLHTVVMTQTAPYYRPSALIVEVGDGVRWINPPPADPHTTQCDSGAFRSPQIGSGEAWCLRLTREGTYDYGCRIHPWMRGRIVVRPSTLTYVPGVRSHLPPPAELQRVTDRGGRWWRVHSGRDRFRRGESGDSVGEEVVLPSSARLTAIARAGAGVVLADSGRSRILVAEAAWTTEHRVPELSPSPRALAVEVDGAVWFAMPLRGRLGRIAGGRLEQFLLAPPGHPESLAFDARGDLWLVDPGGLTLGRVPAAELDRAAGRRSDPCATTFEPAKTGGSHGGSP